MIFINAARKMFKDPFDFSNYIEEITAGQVPDHIKNLNAPSHFKEFELPDDIKDLLEPGRFARKIEAELIPDALVNSFDLSSSISDCFESYSNNLFEPIRSTSESKGILRYKKQVIVLERKIAIIEKNYENNKPLIELAKNTIAEHGSQF